MMTLETRVSVPKEVLCRDLGTEAVLLELQSGQYYGLDETGLRMWSLLQHHGQVGSVFRVLLDEYDAEQEELRSDLMAFVDLLHTRKLLDIHNE